MSKDYLKEKNKDREVIKRRKSKSKQKPICITIFPSKFGCPNILVHLTISTHKQENLNLI